MLAERARQLDEMLGCCALCPRQCGVNRRAGELGACRVDARAKVAAVNLHPWEEPPISGTSGSGTIFFSGCTLNCCFCQNYPISQLGVGRYVRVEDLGQTMLSLQQRGAHNINLVTPTHQMAAVTAALLWAIPRGLRLPIVHNGSGYERVEVLRLLEGIVDIYLPDIKYANAEAAERCSRRFDYIVFNRLALLEMWRQVGPLKVDAAGIAYRGLLIRHLVLPEDLSGTSENLAFLANEFGPEVWISLMHQYFPAHEAHHLPPLDRKVTRDEYERAFTAVTRLGLENGFVQASV
jgi:putative pyruvate formate lyase activating enzyme